MAVPKYYEFYSPILTLLSDGKSHSGKAPGKRRHQPHCQTGTRVYHWYHRSPRSDRDYRNPAGSVSGLVYELSRRWPYYLCLSQRTDRKSRRRFSHQSGPIFDSFSSCLRTGIPGDEPVPDSQTRSGPDSFESAAAHRGRDVPETVKMKVYLKKIPELIIAQPGLEIW